MKSIRLFLLLLAFALVSCGESVSEINVDKTVGLDEVPEGSSIKDMTCDSSKVGNMLYDPKFDVPLICDGNSWLVMKGKDGADGKDGVNGSDGIDGHDGINGENGTFCTIDDYIDHVVLNCNGDTMSVILDWDYSSKCTMLSQSDTLVEVACGTDTTRIRKPGVGDAGEAPSVEAQESIDLSVLESKCGEMKYDEQEKFCVDGKLYDLCAGFTFDVMTSHCVMNTVRPLDVDLVEFCGGFPVIDKSRYTCVDGLIYGTVKFTESRSYNTIVVGQQEWMIEDRWEPECPEGWHIPTEEEFKQLQVLSFDSYVFYDKDVVSYTARCAKEYK